MAKENNEFDFKLLLMKLSQLIRMLRLSVSPPSSNTIPHYKNFLIIKTTRSPGQTYDAYCVYNGKTLGIFTSWYDVARSIDGFLQPKYLGYPTLNEAIDGWNNELRRHPQVAERARQQLNRQKPVDALTDNIASLSLPSTPRRAGPSCSQFMPAVSPVSTPLATMSAQADDTSTFYVVIRGAQPGVYRGSVASWHAVGPSPNAKRVKKDSELEAWKYFGELVMSNQIHYL
ncbi:hypothetical protein CVT24_006652 [Panaeolus cyanescens]|uniref:Ribonuclease H1 N-terminal domain-containing protein n=1 Tax=Panaeolus cyanescens TaxID=181874 RepID=A0A409YSF2_9AGAR|nr:hypothetical protein CVT24_006652 [Panaeolus cyanescens]